MSAFLLWLETAAADLLIWLGTAAFKWFTAIKGAEGEA